MKTGNITYHRVAKRDLHRHRAGLMALAAIYLLYDSCHSRRYPVYIGQTDDAYRRLCQHRRQRSRWDFAIAVAPAAGHPPFTLTDIHYLEARLLVVARRRRRVARRLQNQVMPSQVYAPPDQRPRLDRLLDTLANLLASGPPGHPRGHPRGHPPDKTKTAPPRHSLPASCPPSPRGHPPDTPTGHPPAKPKRPREAEARVAPQPVSPRHREPTTTLKPP